ncbi:orf16 [Artaxa digramma nucleopolyhedrovirus]|uniref:Orf16 n=1 Tax=Artaxa digramma nucleopolyhedrovirus TaxID=3070910 RepID=A0AAE6R673_9ABAC|nr:orf16 [Euproctis digramma nucleopolyhedrovirus]QHB21675.1 orf16 [Artaxa digramma nucleopolyhedrovirus]
MNRYKLNKIFNHKIPHMYVVSKNSSGKIVTIMESLDEKAAASQNFDNKAKIKYHLVDKIVGNNGSKHYVYRCAKEKTINFICI